MMGTYCSVQLTKIKVIFHQHRNSCQAYFDHDRLNADRSLSLFQHSVSPPYSTTCTFKQAVKWEVVAKNPFEFSMHTRLKYEKRDIKKKNRLLTLQSFWNNCKNHLNYCKCYLR